jgi:heme A synthase
MDTMLFTGRSIWTMIHGIVLGGGALMALAAALFSLRAMRVAASAEGAAAPQQARYLAWLMVFAAVMLWLTVLVGLYVNFPPYRATPPEGLTDLSQYPRSLIRSNPGTEWLHSFAMETKEHVPWIAAILATAVAAVSVRYRSQLLSDRRLNGMATVLVAVCLLLVSFAAILGVFINKVAPLE